MAIVPTNKQKYSFSDVIKENAGYSVITLSDNVKHILIPYIQKAILEYNNGNIFTGRVNEFGNYMEKILMNTDLTLFKRPKKSDGKKQQMGYPDLTCTIDNIVVYPDVKIFDQANKSSPQRSFYLSTYDKITSDAVHLVIAFEHTNKKLTGIFHIVDMSNVELSAKIEYNASNKDMYE